MKDLTQGSIYSHLIKMLVPTVLGLIVYSLQPLVDLFFIGELGGAALVGVGAVANIAILTSALTQVLASGTTSLMSRALGAGDEEASRLIYIQAVSLSLLFSIVVVTSALGLSDLYFNAMTTDPEAHKEGKVYLLYFLPYLFILFPNAVIGAALRSSGVVSIPSLIHAVSILTNIVLSPILISGWLTGVPLGVAGAAMSTSASALISFVGLSVYAYRKSGHNVFTKSLFVYGYQYYKRILSIGLPVGGEFFFLFLYMVSVFWFIKDFGSDAQAGFSVGMRVSQFFTMPAVAFLFVLPAIVGQNLGASREGRVKETLFAALNLSLVLSTVLAFITYLYSFELASFFTSNIAIIKIAEEYLEVMAVAFIPSAAIYVMSGLFQGVGNTTPSLYASFFRLLAFALPFLLVPGYSLVSVWFVALVSLMVQVAFCVFFSYRILASMSSATESTEELGAC